MIECFENLVGIRTTCDEQVPSDSGLYIQDLPYINMKLADSLVTDQESGIELLNQLYSTAVNYFVNDVRNQMMPYFKYASILQNAIAGYYPFQKNTFPPIASTYKGIQLQVRQWPYLDVFLSSITLWVDYTGTIALKVFNLSTGEELDSIDVEVVAGEQKTVSIYKNYASNGQILNLFIGYDSTGINSFQSNIYQFLVPFGDCATCYNTPTNRWPNKYVWQFSMSIPVAAQKVQNNLSSVGDCAGISLTYSLKCSLDNWLCQMRDQYAFGLMHRWGMEVLRETQMSNRLNSLVMLKKEEKESLMTFYEQEYTKAMTNSFRNLRIPNDICFHCNAHILTGITIP